MGAGIELAGRRRDGSTFLAEISLSATDTGEGILVMAAVRDVTERLELQAERERLKTQTERDRLERQLHQSQRLESLGQRPAGSRMTSTTCSPSSPTTPRSSPRR